MEFDLPEEEDNPLAFLMDQPENEMKEIAAYIRRVAQYMGIDAHDLHRQILMEWAYNRRDW